MNIDGRLLTGRRQLEIKQADLAVAGGRLLLNASVGLGEGGEYSIGGRLAPGPLRALNYMWPEALASHAREWVHKNVIAGTVIAGKFEFSAAKSGGPRTGANDKGARFNQSVALEARDVQLVSPFGSLPIFAERALVTTSGDQLEVSLPTAAASFGRTRSLNLKQVRFEVGDIWSQEPEGRLGFQLAGRLRDAAGLIGTAGIGMAAHNDVLDAIQKKATGKIDGRLDLILPLYDKPDWAPRVSGKLQIKEVRVKDVFAKHDISGGSFNLNLAPKSINADGEMLVDGVGTKLAWQYILDAPLESQPPIRIEARLDEADRKKLGIKLNHIVRGIVDVEVSLIPRQGGGVGSKVRADATNATISVESLAWVKPAGRQTQLEFDLMPGEQDTVALDGLRVVGDGIAIQGKALLDAKFDLKSFSLPHFSIDRVTRLEINGKADKRGIWKVIVKGQTFEGRSLFKSLFQAGHVSGAPEVSPEQRVGLDLEAEVATVLGFWNSRMSNVRMSLSKRQGLIQAMQLEGRLEGDKLLKAAVVRGRSNRRELHAFSDDAGQALTLVGFYPNSRGGRLRTCRRPRWARRSGEGRRSAGPQIPHPG